MSKETISRKRLASASEDEDEEVGMKDSSKTTETVESSEKTAAQDESSQEAPVVNKTENTTNKSCSSSFTRFRKRYFGLRPLPWWAVFILMMATLTKIRFLFHESPCTVLGLNNYGPISPSALKKSFRNLSLCTHPDRLRGNLKRTPTSYEMQKGETLFNRFNTAKDQLQDLFRLKERRREIRVDKKKKRITSSKTITADEKQKKLAEIDEEIASWEPIEAYCSELDGWTGFDLWKELKVLLEEVGLKDVWEAAYSLFWSLITFEAGILNTIFSLLWFAFLYKCIKSLVMWILGHGFGAPLYLLGAVFIGPFPTLYRFFCMPALRWYVFVLQILEGVGDDENASDKKNEGPAQVEVTGSATSTAHIAAEADDNTNKKLRNRRAKKDKENEIKEKGEKLLEGVSDDEDKEYTKVGPVPTLERKNSRNIVETAPAINPNGYSPDEEEYYDDCDLLAKKAKMSLLDRIKLSSPTPNKSRTEIAAATQFDLLLPLTKPIIPLLMLVFTGQIWSGIVTSLLITQVLRSWVPRLNYETHHLICFAFGFLHTILGVNANEVEQSAASGAGGDGNIRLKWEWGFKDMVAIVNMIMCGAFVSSLSSLGNEPQFCCSFGSGLAFRIFLSSDLLRQMSFYESATTEVASFFTTNLGVVFDQVEDLVMNAGYGIGDCGGGLFRSAANGSESLSVIILVLVKIFLLILPSLSAVQWVYRAVKGSKGIFTNENVRKKKRLARVLTRGFLGVMGLLQCAQLAFFTYNAANGGLVNFWLAFLLGAVFESLLGVDDIRGIFRQLMVAMVFIFI